MRSRFLILCLFLFLSLTILFPYKAVADTVFTIGSNTYLHDNHSIALDVMPQILNGRTFVPVRYLAESCGANVIWDPVNRAVTLTEGQTKIQLVIGSKQELVNGQIINMDVAPVVLNDRTLLPARWVAENMGQQISWNDKNNTVTIYPKQAAIQAGTENVRQAPGLQYGILGMLPQNTSVNILNDVNDWYEIALPGGNKGWLAGWLTTTSAGNATTNISLIQPSSTLSNDSNVIADAGPAVSRGGAQLSPNLFSGLGVWTSIYTKLPDNNDIARFNSAGVKRIYLEVASKDGFTQERQNWINTLVPVAHRAGIKVIGWAYTSLSDPVSDARLIDQVSNYQTPGKDRLDAVAADIEELPSNDLTQSQEIVLKFTQTAYSGLRADCPLLAITYPPQQRPNYPYTTMAKSFNGIILMDYWHVNERPYNKAEVTQFVSQSVAALTQAGCRVPIEVALEGCDIGAGMVTATEMDGAVCGARASGVSYSLYCYNTPDNQVWNTFTS